MMIKVVSFDIGGTLLEDSHDNPNNYNLKELAKIVNIPYKMLEMFIKMFFKSQMVH